jgi:hypothetical protein
MTILGLIIQAKIDPMKSPYSLFSIVLICILSACSIQKNLPLNRVVGSYKTHYVCNYTPYIELRSDSTFYYSLGDTYPYHANSTGKFTIKGKRLIVNSDIQKGAQADTLNYSLLQARPREENKIKITVLCPEKETLAGTTCYLKKGNHIINGTYTDENGIAYLDRMEADTLVITYVGYNNIHHPLQASPMGDFTFQMKEQFTYLYLTHAEWEINGRELSVEKGPLLTREKKQKR